MLFIMFIIKFITRTIEKQLLEVNLFQIQFYKPYL